MKKQTSIIFYILGVYVVLQFAWWGFHLIELTREIGKEQQEVSGRVTMIIGEGLVFFVLLIAGLWKIQNSIKKDLRLAERQKNFLLSVTHELKTPIAANKLFWQTLEKRELNPDQKKDIIQKAILETDRLEQLIDNILNASRIENKAMQIISEQINLSDLIRSTASHYEKRYQRTFLEFQADQNITMKTDKYIIETILGNLIENAVKYAGFDANITVYLRSTGSKIIFGVKDNGPGVPRNQRSTIFTKFYRIENEDTRTKKGTGLGLYITAEFVHLLNGKISCKDNTPTGADFEVILPQ